jgi:hypothetical protein
MRIILDGLLTLDIGSLTCGLVGRLGGIKPGSFRV